jgi:hypothetical protein
MMNLSSKRRDLVLTDDIVCPLAGLSLAFEDRISDMLHFPSD